MMVMVPKDVAADYWHLPWSRVLAAAERGEDGLEVRSPKWTPWRRDAPRPDQYPPESQARYEKDRAAWEEEQNVCFLYEADRSWPVRDKTILFQQNWCIEVR